MILQAVVSLIFNDCWLLLVLLYNFRKLFGKFNVLSVAFVPCFLCSLVAILIERPSRRGLLSLYVTNVVSHFHNLCLIQYIIYLYKYVY